MAFYTGKAVDAASLAQMGLADRILAVPEE